ncbi:Uncharacterised protein [uncultured archaeon]|nr:Uncharacterised protein [uncultured archaeon]
MSRNGIFEKVGRILTGCIKATENAYSYAPLLGKRKKNNMYIY